MTAASLRLFDQRRLGRVRLDPNLDALGPDAEQVRPREFGERIGRGHAPVKARLLDQSVIAGVGNLLADETLWQARLAPTRPADELTDAELITLHRAMRRATKAAINQGRRTHRKGSSRSAGPEPTARAAAPR